MHQMEPRSYEGWGHERLADTKRTGRDKGKRSKRNKRDKREGQEANL